MLDEVQFRGSGRIPCPKGRQRPQVAMESIPAWSPHLPLVQGARPLPLTWASTASLPFWHGGLLLGVAGPLSQESQPLVVFANMKTTAGVVFILAAWRRLPQATVMSGGLLEG